MIQANELRIGNIINENVVGNSTVIMLWDGSVWIENIEAGDGVQYEIDYKNVNPIPLTPEILEKCGFKKGKSKGVARFVDDIEDIDPKDKHRYTYFWDLKIPENNHVEDLYSFNLVQFGKGTDILWKHQMLAVKVTSLHQLQNLFYSLTGQELIYKP